MSGSALGFQNGKSGSWNVNKAIKDYEDYIVDEATDDENPENVAPFGNEVPPPPEAQTSKLSEAASP